MIDPAVLLVFTSALLVAAASPGPGIAAIVARVLGRGMRGAVAFTAGVALGDVVWLTIAILGLSALAQTFHGVFLAVKYAGVAYLLGALIYARQWPDPWPGRFGHHEIWHLFVLLGAGAHFAFTYSLVGRAYPPF